MIGQTVSHYRILSRLAEGGMGVVYVAEDTRLRRRVAIKFPHASEDERHYRTRFLREARAVSKLNHPNIASVYDFGETEDGQPYIVMELVAGESLSDLLAQGLTLARAIEIVQDVAAALAEAHRRGVVHRDVKPSNVLINERGEVKVLDFGLAKHIDEEAAAAAREEGRAADYSLRTRSDVVIGTPLYLSPEQARGGQVDARSDLFVLGALLYECVAGRPPFGGANFIEIGAQVLYTDPPPPSRLNSRVPADLDRVALKALAKKPEERFQTAEQFIAALEPLRARLSKGDATRTRRLTTHANALRSSALTTISDAIRRPRYSPLALFALFIATLAAVWGYAYLRKPATHRPKTEAVELYNQGIAALREGAFHRASLAFGEAVRVDERHALARARLAEAWAELDFLDRAKDEMLRVHDLVPSRSALEEIDALYLDAIAATVRRDFKAAVEVYKKLAELRPEAPESHLDLARAYEKNEEIEKAIASYMEATRLDPSNAAAHLRLGAIYGRQSNQAAALSALAEAEKLYASADNREGRAEARLQRGVILFNARKLSEARRELESSLALARETGNKFQEAQSLIQLSQLASREAKHAEAIAQAEEAIGIAQSGDMPSLSARAIIALGSANFIYGRLEEAAAQYSRALDYARANRLRRFDAQALANLGSVRLQQKRIGEGLRYAEQAYDYYRQGAYSREAFQVALLLGRTKWQMGDLSGALKSLEEQLRISEQAGNLPQLADAHSELSMLRLSIGDLPAALRHVDETQAIRKHLDDKFPLGHVRRAETLWRLGRTDEARNALAEGVSAAGPREGGDKNLHTYITLVKMYLALGERRHAEVEQLLKLVLEMNSPYKEQTIEAKRIACLSAVRARARSNSICEEAAREVAQVENPLFDAIVQLTLAESRLDKGDASGALASARRAQEFFAKAELAELEWKAHALLSLANRRAGDEENAREHSRLASELLARLRERWGAEATALYLARADNERLHKEASVLISTASL